MEVLAPVLEELSFARHRAGTIRIVMARATCMIDADGEPTAFVTAHTPKAISGVEFSRRHSLPIF